MQFRDLGNICLVTFNPSSQEQLNEKLIKTSKAKILFSKQLLGWQSYFFIESMSYFNKREFITKGLILFLRIIY